MDLWKGSGLLSALNLLKTLTWPTTMPTYSLQSNLLGTFTLDFSAWSGMLTAIRSIIIAIAGFVAYKISLWGHDDRTAESHLLLPAGHDRELQRHLAAGLGFGSWSGGCVVVVGGTGGLAVPVIADQYAWLLGSDRPVSSDRHYRGGDGGAVPLAVGALCAVGVVVVKLLTVVLQESQYEVLAEMGREEKLSPAQVLVKIVGEYLKIRLALWEIGQVGRRGARMIEMLEGVPGSGKSYYAVSERLLKWVRAGRRVYVFVDGFYLDRLALFEGVELAVLRTANYALAYR